MVMTSTCDDDDDDEEFVSLITAEEEVKTPEHRSETTTPVSEGESNSRQT